MSSPQQSGASGDKNGHAAASGATPSGVMGAGALGVGSGVYSDIGFGHTYPI